MENTTPPRIDLTIDPESIQHGTEQWKLTSQRVREAMETCGCILVKYDKNIISDKDKERLFEATRSLFDLPTETKRKNSSFKDSLSAYPGDNPFVPLYQALGVMNAMLPEKSKAFTQLMWHHGNDQFCNTLNSMSNKMLDLSWLLMSMILDSYGLSEKYQDSLKESTDSLFHMIKYTAPEKEEPALGLGEHTDVNYLTLLCQNEVAGLSIKIKEGEWVSVDPGQDHFVVFVGQSLRAWSNGRMHPPLHQVTFSGLKDRLTYASFLMPRPGEIVQVAAELVDEEHPPLMEPYAYEDFLKYSKEFGASEDVLEKFNASIWG